MPKIKIISLGNKMPQWVDQAVDNYIRRIPKTQFEVTVLEIPLLKRSNTANLKNIITQESDLVLSKIPPDYLHISLERTGKNLSSQKLAGGMQNWLDDGQNVAICIGGPEGFSATHIAKAHQIWSISALTMAHPVVRVVLAEQLYRGWSILAGHPYHRGNQL